MALSCSHHVQALLQVYDHPTSQMRLPANMQDAGQFFAAVAVDTSIRAAEGKAVVTPSGTPSNCHSLTNNEAALLELIGLESACGKLETWWTTSKDETGVFRGCVGRTNREACSSLNPLVEWILDMGNTAVP
ncbi:hypothetical protein NDU88_003966 [Pleurodeles waltl]|uniref:RNase H type-1 domain-containing protein n=1 Tax=Pleurodeles waltl TaxID=8319 RepID=A0AAV7KWE2_PLEWA|nr:hypothetical protein NDU88_003966 [Pleurodeles waltl]